MLLLSTKKKATDLHLIHLRHLPLGNVVEKVQIIVQHHLVRLIHPDRTLAVRQNVRYRLTTAIVIIDHHHLHLIQQQPHHRNDIDNVQPAVIPIGRCALFVRVMFTLPNDSSAYSTTVIMFSATNVLWVGNGRSIIMRNRKVARCARFVRHLSHQANIGTPTRMTNIVLSKNTKII